MGKARQITSSIAKIKNRKTGRILVITGARQVGKTTLVKNLLDDYTYLSIEDPVVRGSYTQLTSSQWHTLYPKASLDEVQKAPVLIESIKAAYDQYPDVRYVLLGSSQLLLLQKVRESLAGRCTIFDMYPLTLPELQTSNWSDNIQISLWQRLLKQQTPDFFPSFLMDPRMAAKKAAWDYLLRFGGYPALVDEELTDQERYQWLHDYVRTYLERDIRDLASFRDLEPFVKLQHSFALQTAHTLNASTLSRDLGISAKTVQHYLEYLNISYQALTLPSWSRNQNKRLIKAPKVHLLDMGVLQAVLRKHGGLTGAEFESAVVSELYKQARNILSNADFYHLRTLDGREVDLLVELENGYFAFEIKMASNISKTDARHLLKLEEFLDKPLLHAFVLSNDNTTRRITDKITAIHTAMFLG